MNLALFILINIQKNYPDIFILVCLCVPFFATHRHYLRNFTFPTIISEPSSSFDPECLCMWCVSAKAVV